MKPYYQDDAVTLYHGDNREILPSLGRFDLLLKNRLTNSSECATVSHENEPQRIAKNGNSESCLGTTHKGNSMAISQAVVVNGEDCGLLWNLSDRDVACDSSIGDRITRARSQGQGEWAIQGRKAEHTLQTDDREGKMLSMRESGSACDSSQERRPLRQSLGKPSGSLLVLSQQNNKNSVLETDAGKWGIVSDPPYGIGYIHGEGGGCLARSTKFAGVPIHGDDAPFDPSIWLQFPAVILWGANHYASRLPDSQSWLIWDKRDGICQNDQADCEMAWTNLGGPARLMHHLWNGMIKASEKCERRHHPTQKPVSVMTWCISMIPKGLTILDPFAGSGTTGRAAKDMGRKCVMIEREEKYCEIAAKRMSQEVLSL